MPHNACTIILNGHGCYSPDKIVNILSYHHDYNLFFPCNYRESITVSHHNLILADLTTCSKDQIITRLQVMELSQTTSIINKQAPAFSFMTDMTSINYSSLFFEHSLSNAPEMIKAHTLEHINGVFGHSANRFHSVELLIIDDPATHRNWGNGKLQVDFDIEEAHANVLENFAQASSTLSASNILSIRPTAPEDQKATFMLSDLISTIIPKIKIFASKHADGSAEVLPYVFLDDRQNTAQNFIDMMGESQIFQNYGDQLHELTIAGDANIIWDACREIVL
jgi:hypothetical protein